MSTRERQMTETEWMRQVTDLADLLGWAWVHFRPARTEHSWRTAVSGPLGAGWPDLVLVRERVVYAELKRRDGRMSAVQLEARDRLRAAGAEHHVWIAPEITEVQAVLARRSA